VEGYKGGWVEREGRKGMKGMKGGRDGTDAVRRFPLAPFHPSTLPPFVFTNATIAWRD
jgi:hypothetical protein